MILAPQNVFLGKLKLCFFQIWTSRDRIVIIINFNSRFIKWRKYKAKIYTILIERKHKEKFSLRFDEKKLFYSLNISSVFVHGWNPHQRGWHDTCFNVFNNMATICNHLSCLSLCHLVSCLSIFSTYLPANHLIGILAN